MSTLILERDESLLFITGRPYGVDFEIAKKPGGSGGGIFLSARELKPVIAYLQGQLLKYEKQGVEDD